MTAKSATKKLAKSSWPETRIESWADLQETIDSLAVQCVFRGQGSSDWPLISSFNRLTAGADEAVALQWEFASIIRFRSEAHLYLPPTVMPPNLFKLSALDTYLEWLMLMQHYGAPTRLLDWSQSPYVGTYFAVIDPGKNDAVVWYFTSRVVEEALCTHYGRNAGGYLDYADFSSEEIRRPGDAPMLYTAMKKFRTPREVAQQGVFTFTNRLIADHESVIPQACQGQPFGRIIIPKELKAEFCFRLSLMNVTAAALFPGVEGVCAAIRDNLRLQAENLALNQPLEPPAASMAQAE
jgi:hypothetical protein